MKNRLLKTKLLTVLLALCMVLSIVPITAFAESGAYAVKFYPGDYGTMAKNDQIPFVYYNIDHDVNKPFYYKLNVSSTDTLGFAGSIIDTLLPNQGYEFAYWTADATVYQAGSGTAIPAGTPLSSDQIQNSVNVRSDNVIFTAQFKQSSGHSDDSVISSAEIVGATLSYNPGDEPRATAEVYNADADKYEIAYECWQQFKGNEPVAAWYSDNGAHGSLPTITEFESGEKYVYFLMLKAKNGRTFAATDSGLTVTVNGWTVEQQNISVNLDGQSVYVTGIATIRPTKPVEPKEISVIEINNATLTFKDGDKPVFTGTVPENDQYAFRCEWWSLDENTGIVSTEPEWGGDIYTNKITAFEAGKTYHYGVYVTAYTADISPDAKLKINGREVEYTRIGDASDTQSFWVETDLTMTPTADGHTHSYGTDWKNDSANHWHECSCGEKSELAAHSFKWVIDKEATATEKGSKHEECTVCDHKKAAVEIPTTGSATHPTNPNNSTDNKTDETTNPNTGDNSNLALWIALLFISGGGIIGSTVYSKKRE